MSRPREIPYVAAEAVIALRRAMICPEQEHIWDIALGVACPVCGSRECVPLSRWLSPMDDRGAGIAWWIGQGR